MCSPSFQTWPAIDGLHDWAADGSPVTSIGGSAIRFVGLVGLVALVALAGLVGTTGSAGGGTTSASIARGATGWDVGRFGRWGSKGAATGIDAGYAVCIGPGRDSGTVAVAGGTPVARAISSLIAVFSLFAIAPDFLPVTFSAELRTAPDFASEIPAALRVFPRKWHDLRNEHAPLALGFVFHQPVRSGDALVCGLSSN